MAIAALIDESPEIWAVVLRLEICENFKEGVKSVAIEMGIMVVSSSVIVTLFFLSKVA